MCNWVLEKYPLWMEGSALLITFDGNVIPLQNVSEIIILMWKRDNFQNDFNFVDNILKNCST